MSIIFFKSMTKAKRNGFSLVEVLVASAISALGFTIFMTGTNSVLAVKGKIDSFRSVQNFQNELLGQLNSSPAWSKTVSKISNTSLGCLRSQSNCYGQGGSFIVYDQEGKIFFDPATQGVNEQGEKCASPGTAQCPYRFEISWSPICSGNPCYNSAVRFDTKIVQAVVGQEPPKITGGLLDSKFNQSFEGNSLKSSCLAVNGNYDDLTGECALSLQGECPSNNGVQQVVVGITPNMLKVCKPVYFNAICDANSYFAGVRSDGSAYCAPKDCCVSDYCSGIDLFQKQPNCSALLIQGGAIACGGPPPPPPPPPGPPPPPPPPPPAPAPPPPGWGSAWCYWCGGGGDGGDGGGGDGGDGGGDGCGDGGGGDGCGDGGGDGDGDGDGDGN